LRSQSTQQKSVSALSEDLQHHAGGTLEVNNYKGTIHVTGSDTNQSPLT